MTRDMLSQLLHVIEQEAEAKERHARVSVNMAQAVMRADFSGSLPQAEVTVEEANEGESIDVKED